MGTRCCVDRLTIFKQIPSRAGRWRTEWAKTRVREQNDKLGKSGCSEPSGIATVEPSERIASYQHNKLRVRGHARLWAFRMLPHSITPAPALTLS